MDYAAKCKDYIQQNGIAAEQVFFTGTVRTAKEAADMLGIPLDQIVKTVVLYVHGKFIACILRGSDKVDFAKVRKMMDSGDVRIATRDEVLSATGYPVGGVPPFGYDLPFYIDNGVMTLPVCYAGGGSDQALVKMTPNELIKATKAVVVSII